MKELFNMTDEEFQQEYLRKYQEYDIRHRFDPSAPTAKEIIADDLQREALNYTPQPVEERMTSAATNINPVSNQDTANSDRITLSREEYSRLIAGSVRQPSAQQSNTGMNPTVQQPSWQQTAVQQQPTSPAVNQQQSNEAPSNETKTLNPYEQALQKMNGFTQGNSQNLPQNTQAIQQQQQQQQPNNQIHQAPTWEQMKQREELNTLYTSSGVTPEEVNALKTSMSERDFISLAAEVKKQKALLQQQAMRPTINRETHSISDIHTRRDQSPRRYQRNNIEFPKF